MNDLKFPVFSGKLKKNQETEATMLIDCEYIANCVKHNVIDQKGHTMHRVFYMLTHWLERTHGYEYGLSEGFVNKLNTLNESQIKRSYNPNGQLFTLEHAIPVKVITKQMVEKNIDTAEKVMQFIKDTYHLHLVTKEEDKLLNKAKLSKTMPSEYYDPNHEWYMDPMARYKKVGIVISKNVKK
jgi:hypothetical protein